MNIAQRVSGAANFHDFIVSVDPDNQVIAQLTCSFQGHNVTNIEEIKRTCKKIEGNSSGYYPETISCAAREVADRKRRQSCPQAWGLLRWRIA